MTTTINVSMPEKLYKDAKKLVAEEKYNSISEVIRAGLRRIMYDADKITENGFPGWFEDQVLESAAEPLEKDIDKYFKKLHNKVRQRKQKKYVQDRENWQISSTTG